MNAIEVLNVSKRYGDFALQNVSFTLPQGCIVGLVGENGAGKSTLIRMMLGACRPDSGEVRTLGVRADRSDAFTQVKQEVGVVLDEACLPDELTAAQISRVMAGVYAGWDAQAYADYTARFAIPSGKRVREYSRGTKMKLVMAVALSHGAKLLVLDEATGGLDPVVRDEILDILNDFTREEEHSVLISSHIVTDLEKICDYIVFLSRGRVLLAEEKDALGEKYAVLTLTKAQYDALPRGCALRVMRAHGALRVLALRERLPRDIPAQRAAIEDMMLLLEKGEKPDEGHAV